MRRELRALVGAMAIAGFTMWLADAFVQARQVPIQDQQPVGSALMRSEKR